MGVAGKVEDQDGRDGARGSAPWDGLSLPYVRTVAAERLKALGHPDRLRIVEVLSRQPTHVGEIATRVGLPLGSVSRHMRVLHAAGVVECTRDGNRVLYVLSDRDISRLAVVAYRGAAGQARRLIAGAPDSSGESSATESPGS